MKSYRIIKFSLFSEFNLLHLHKICNIKYEKWDLCEIYLEKLNRDNFVAKKFAYTITNIKNLL